MSFNHRDHRETQSVFYFTSVFSVPPVVDDHIYNLNALRDGPGLLEMRRCTGSITYAFESRGGMSEVPRLAA
ncbi:hypothetical protein SCL_0539 [Sulfuricaulis limicola]|uniref:Uncharacterized protein n=1 Tax=Sulfuricaulis limicola TaxID=1620215 RepID=A0A1B4XDJ1_9GAMM|nr:hypothetical protein SCL_0539 [Sulfuricaulis limicola]